VHNFAIPRHKAGAKIAHGPSENLKVSCPRDVQLPREFPFHALVGMVGQSTSPTPLNVLGYA